MKNVKIVKKYEKFKWFFSSSGTLVVGGKSDSGNEIVLKEYLEQDYIVTHTSSPGSPFCIIIKDNPSKKDILEACIFCSCFSKDWKLGKKEISVDIFKRNQIYKNKLMKSGTFGVKGGVKKIKVKPELFLVVQKGKLRAVPKGTYEEVICKITQGRLNKEKASEKIWKIIKDKYQLPISKSEIMSAIPSDMIDVR